MYSVTSLPRSPTQRKYVAKVGGQVKTCSRCGQQGHRRDGGHCPLTDSSVGVAPPPRWVGQSKLRKTMKLLRRCLWRGARVHRREPWDPPYVREISPGKAKRKRFTCRAKLDATALIAEGSKQCFKALVHSGILRRWAGTVCLKCGVGKYSELVNGDLHRFT